jgi:cytoskeletal protein RodZ
MNHTIKGIILVVVITSMLVVGASIIPIMQSSFASKKSDFKGADPNANTNTNTNSADSSSSSDATAENTNNIDNTATASNSQEQDACAVAVTCQEGSTTVTSTPPPADPCPHSPYTDFVAGTGCQDVIIVVSPPTCNPSTVGGQTATPTGGTCTATILSSNPEALAIFALDCSSIPGSTVSPNEGGSTCTFPSTPPTQTCPTPTGSTQTPTVVNGRCTIQPGPT